MHLVAEDVRPVRIGPFPSVPCPCRYRPDGCRYRSDRHIGHGGTSAVPRSVKRCVRRRRVREVGMISIGRQWLKAHFCTDYLKAHSCTDSHQPHQPHQSTLYVRWSFSRPFRPSLWMQSAYKVARPATDPRHRSRVRRAVVDEGRGRVVGGAAYQV
jgi:hypothetical protein